MKRLSGQTRFLRMAAVGAVLLWARPLWAGGEGGVAVPGHGPGATLFWLAVILLGAKVFSLVEKLGKPSVLGEILFGVLLGNSV